MEAGQVEAHFPQPTQRAGSIWAYRPFNMEIALVGQAERQQPQATQRDCETFAFCLGRLTWDKGASSLLLMEFSIQDSFCPYRDNVTSRPRERGIKTRTAASYMLPSQENVF